MFKKYFNRLKNKVFPCLLSICLISCISAPLASAASYTGTVTIGRKVWLSGAWHTSDSQNRQLPISNYAHNSFSPTNLASVYFNTQNTTTFNGVVDVYISYYVRGINSNQRYPYVQVGNPYLSSNYSATYVDVNETVKSTSSIQVDSFAPQDSLQHGQGVSLKVSFRGSEDMPIKNLTVQPASSEFGWLPNGDLYQTSQLVYTSVRVITSQSSAELDALAGVADEIAKQSDLLAGMKGEIVAILQDIYLRLGDMEKAQELLVDYLDTLVPLVENIDSTTTDIYNLLVTQFELLRTSINTASTDIQSAISAQTSALIAYFDTVFSGAVGQLPEKSDDLETEIGNVGNAESEYKSNASAQFENLSTQFDGFTGGTLSGIALASNLFTQTWNALGEYSIVYSFPLLFGLCLLLIGRLSKHSGGQSSTDKERGDSDA